LKHPWSLLLRIELILFGVALMAAAFLRAPVLERVMALGPVRPAAAAIGALCLALGIALSLPPLVARIGAQRLESRARYVQRAAAWCVLPLLFFEIFLRVYLYIPVLWNVNTNWFGPVPAEGSFVLLGNEGFALTHYSKLGEIRTPYDSGATILFVGDSRTEAKQVSDAEKFSSVAETLLHQRGVAVNARNLGEGGRAMADYVTYLPMYKELYAPAAIVIQVSENDFNESFSPGKENYFRLDGGKIDIVHKYETRAPFEVDSRRTLNLYPMVARQALRQFELIFPGLPSAAGDDAEAETSGEQAAEERIRQQLDLLLDAAGGTPLIFVLAPSVPAIKDGAIVTADASYERFRQIITRHSGSTVVDPLPRFQELAKQGYFPVGFFNSAQPDRGHLNRHGNRVLGELLADAIEEVLR